MRKPTLLLVLSAVSLVACHPSATLERTTPVANLQIYHAVSVRVQAAPNAGGEAQGQAEAVEFALVNRLRTQCGFEQVQAASQGEAGKADLVLDLNVLRVGRGGDGIIQNQNLATLDALLVLSDGVSGDLLGSAKIHGQSSQMLVGGASPEQQAADVVAETVGDLLGKSGCSGPRVARAAELPPDHGTATTTTTASGDAGPGPVDTTTSTGGVTPGQRAEADKLNDEGKQLFRSADVHGAMAKFDAATQLAPDPRYTFNTCLGHEALEEWDAALASCNQALGQHPSDALGEKISARIDILKQRQAGK